MNKINRIYVSIVLSSSINQNVISVLSLKMAYIYNYAARGLNH